MRRRVVACLLLACLCEVALAQTVATVTHLSGVLTARRADGVTRVLAVKSTVEQGDTVVTERDTFARLKFEDQSEVVLRPGSQLKVERFSYNAAKPEADGLGLNLLKGGMRAVSGLIGKRSKEAVAYTTPTATIGIRGTHFGALLCQRECSDGAQCQSDCSDVPTTSGIPLEDGLHVDVAQGAIELRNGAATVVVETGKFGYVRDVTTIPKIVPPEQGVQVTMPISISQNKRSDAGGAARGSSDGQCAAQ